MAGTFATRRGIIPALLATILCGFLAGAVRAQTITYSYDALGRLTAASGSTSSTYGYDPADNRTSEVVTGPGGAPVAGPVSASVFQNTINNPIPLNITGAPTSVAVFSAPSHGTAAATGTSISYTPNSAYTGPDSFQYTASNSFGTSPPASVSITVLASTGTAPIANQFAATVGKNSANNPLPLNITGGAPTSASVYSAPLYGTASASGISILYTPPFGYSGPDLFQYTASNSYGTSAPAYALIHVGPGVWGAFIWGAATWGP